MGAGRLRPGLRLFLRAPDQALFRDADAGVFADRLGDLLTSGMTVTGGDQGLPEIPYPNLDWMSAVPGLGDLRIGDALLPVLTLVLVAVSLAVLHQIVRSPFGRMLTTIRENPERAAFIGAQCSRLPACGLCRRRRLRRARRRALRHLQPRRLRRLCVLVEIGRGHDHDHPRRHGLFLGAAGRRLGAGLAQPADHRLYPVLAVCARQPCCWCCCSSFPAGSSAGSLPDFAWRAGGWSPARCLRSRDLRKSFAGFVAVGGVSLTVETRQIVAVIGPNGAGKSTLFQPDHRSSQSR